MRQLITLLLVLFIPLLAQENDNYEAQKFFDRSDIDAFLNSDTGEMLKEIIVNGHSYYMQQDGDLYDEDIATIEEPLFQVKGESFSFERSKRLLATEVYPNHQKAFYSDCDYTIKEKKLIPLPKSCGFHYRKNKNRSERIEWEHIVPAWHFGHQLQCWQKGGRMTCRQTNTKFKKMEADMHNLVPAIGEINGDRSNFKYGMIEGEERVYGKINMEISFSNKKAEPRDTIFGDIARTYFYMRDEYGLQISNAQEKMLIAWNNLDPVSRWEQERNAMIKKLQGTENLYITNYQKLKQLGTPSNDASTTYDEIHTQLEEEYGSLLNKLPAPLASIILIGLTLFVMYRRKQTQPQEPTTHPSSPHEAQKEEPIHTKHFMIISQMAQSAISINDQDEVIIEKADKNNPNQQSIFTKANQKKEYFFIENLTTGKVIEIEDANSNDGSKIIVNKKKSRKNDHQEWKLESAEQQGYVFIMSKWSLNVLDIKYKQTKDGSKLQSFHKKVRGTENQEWKIVRY